MIRALVIAVALGSAHHAVPAFAGCVPGSPQVRPSSLLLTCADGNFVLAGLVWSRWDATGADARGVGLQNECPPGCLRGRFDRYRVTVQLSRPRICAGGLREFTRFMLRFVGAAPSGQRAATLKSPFYSGAGCP